MNPPLDTPLPDPPEVDPLLAAASARLDGAATDADRARLATDPGAAADVMSDLRAVARLVAAAPPAQSTQAAERAIAAALGAADEAGGNVVVPISGRRRARWLAPLAAAAAALLLVIGIAGTLRSGSEDETSSTTALNDLAGPSTTAGAEAMKGAEDASAALSADGAAPLPPQASQSGGGSAGVGAAASPAAPAYDTQTLDGGDVGRVEDPSELAQRVIDAIDGATDDPDTVRTSAPPSDVAACIAKAPGEAPTPIVHLRWRAVGTFEEAKITALAYEKRDGSGLLLLLFTLRDCTLVTTEDF